MEEAKKETGLFKKLDIAFVYLFIFLVGIGIILGMTSYLNSKVKEFSDSSVAYAMER